MKNLLSIVLFGSLFLSQSIVAQVPLNVGLQGVLLDSGGIPIADGSHDLTFRVYDAETNGSLLWEEVQEITTTSGIFSVSLGHVTPLDLPFDKPYWVGVSVDSDPELSPRIPLSASPYSLNSRLTNVFLEDGEAFTLSNSADQTVHRFEAGGNVVLQGSLKVNDVPIVAPGDLTPPGESADADPRFLVWSQSDNVLRWIGIEPGSDDGDWIIDVDNSELVTGNSIVLRTDTSEPFRVNAEAPIGVARLLSHSDAGIGLDGSSDTGVGIIGSSLSGDAAHFLGDVRLRDRSPELTSKLYLESIEISPGDPTTILVRDPDGFIREKPFVGGGSGDTDWVEDMANALVYTANNIAMRTGGVEPFRVNLAAPAGTPRLVAGTNDGIGVQGNTNIGYGVRGTAAQGVGVHGTSQNFGDAILGEAVNGNGVHGKADGGSGVRGESMLFNGVTGETDASNQAGVFGDGKNGSDGVHGSTDAPNLAGVRGDGRTQGYGVIGETVAANLAGVYGDGGALSHGVHGITNAPNLAGVKGDGTDNGIGVHGVSKAADGTRGETDTGNGAYGSTKAEVQELLEPELIGRGTDIKAGTYGTTLLAYGAFGFSSEKSGVFGLSSKSNGVTGGTFTDDRSRAGVYGAAEKTTGVYGRSKIGIGVLGRTIAAEDDVTDPSQIKSFDTDDNAAVFGYGTTSFGTLGQAGSVSGVMGVSAQSNGVTGTTTSENPDRAGVTGLSSSASGVLGWSVSGSGVRGKSQSGAAGEFEGEVHIEDSDKNAKLKIESMEDDPTAPCLVWSADMYVRKRDCWILDGEGEEAYLVSEHGIRVKNGETTVFEVNKDGTSTHTGLETYEAGLEIPLGGNIYVRLLPGDGISVYNKSTMQYLWHANPNGDSFAANSFSTNFLSAESVSSAVKQFRIDHPLDPRNKVLTHTSVESNERMNVYSGNITTDENAFATVILPAWFEALNTDFRYQLTVIGSFSQAIISQELVNNQFVIQTSEPGVKVSWQVTGIRHDAWAKSHPNQVEIEKTGEQRGQYLHPQAFGESPRELSSDNR